MTTSRYVGFYWTLPVLWAGFSALPSNVDEAAKKSRTICYQRERVRQWVRDEPGVLIAEEAFLELAPDRGSEHITPELDALLTTCMEQDATLVIVDFSEAYGWRRHHYLWHHLDESSARHMRLDPVAIRIDGENFDPVEHFRTWRRIDQTHVGDKELRRALIVEEIGRLSQLHPTYGRLADALNERGLSTLNGRPWTADNIRKFTK